MNITINETSKIELGDIVQSTSSKLYLVTSDYYGKYTLVSLENSWTMKSYETIDELISKQIQGVKQVFKSNEINITLGGIQ